LLCRPHSISHASSASAQTADVQTPDGLRALTKEQPIAPSSVEKYLSGKFKAALGPVSAAMAQLANPRAPEELAAEAYALYEQFRPAIPAGEAGWGAAGTLSLAKIRELATKK
jgi:hypothetical protein